MQIRGRTATNSPPEKSRRVLHFRSRSILPMSLSDNVRVDPYAEIGERAHAVDEKHPAIPNRVEQSYRKRSKLNPLTQIRFGRMRPR